jgi:hypothetical protein
MTLKIKSHFLSKYEAYADPAYTPSGIRYLGVVSFTCRPVKPAVSPILIPGKRYKP